VTASTSSRPRVTVVTTVYNVVRYLGDAIGSLQAQTYKDWELVLVDDGSTAPEAEHALAEWERRGFTVIRTENRGIGAARNTGIAAGSGEFVIALDSDDRLAPTFLERTVAALDDAPEAGFSVPGVEVFGKVHGKRMPPEYDPVALLCSNVVGGYALTRRSCWEQVGGYPERPAADIDGFEDWSLLLSIVERGWRWAVVPEYLFHYRVRGDSMSASNRRPERRAEVLRTFAEYHEELYRQHAVDVFLAFDAKVRKLQTTGPCAFARRVLRRL
jgi:glycosyltransferase involved in cell wall biosynthesis